MACLNYTATRFSVFLFLISLYLYIFLLLSHSFPFCLLLLSSACFFHMPSLPLCFYRAEIPHRSSRLLQHTAFERDKRSLSYCARNVGVCLVERQQRREDPSRTRAHSPSLSCFSLCFLSSFLISFSLVRVCAVGRRWRVRRLRRTMRRVPDARRCGRRTSGWRSCSRLGQVCATPRAAAVPTQRPLPSPASTSCVAVLPTRWTSKYLLE